MVRALNIGIGECDTDISFSSHVDIAIARGASNEEAATIENISHLRFVGLRNIERDRDFAGSH
jgi:hypothetical protein